MLILGSQPEILKVAHELCRWMTILQGLQLPEKHVFVVREEQSATRVHHAIRGTLQAHQTTINSKQSQHWSSLMGAYLCDVVVLFQPPMQGLTIMKIAQVHVATPDSTDRTVQRKFVIENNVLDDRRVPRQA